MGFLADLAFFQWINVGCLLTEQKQIFCGRSVYHRTPPSVTKAGNALGKGINVTVVNQLVSSILYLEIFTYPHVYICVIKHLHALKLEISLLVNIPRLISQRFCLSSTYTYLYIHIYVHIYTYVYI